MGEVSSVRRTKVVVGAFALAWSVALWIFIALTLADQPAWWYPTSFVAASGIPLALLSRGLESMVVYLVATVVAFVLVLLGGFTIGALWLPVVVSLLVNAVLSD